MSWDQEAADLLIAHTRLSDDGKCSCGHVVPLGHSFAAHQADALAPVVAREVARAKVEALRGAAESITERHATVTHGYVAGWLHERADALDTEAGGS